MFFKWLISITALTGTRTQWLGENKSRGGQVAWHMENLYEGGKDTLGITHNNILEKCTSIVLHKLTFGGSPVHMATLSSWMLFCSYYCH